jgi:SAM-dependent methyltransferase
MGDDHRAPRVASLGADFDATADSYRSDVQRSIDFCGAEVEHFTRRKADHLADLAERLIGPPGDLDVLDVGCGVGETDALLAGRFATLHGVDIASDAVDRAAARNPAVHYGAYDGVRLPFTDARFDLAFAVCVVHHVPPEQRAAFFAEMARVVRPGGLVAVFEHNPLNPLTRLAVSRCELDDGVRLLTRGSVRRLLAGAGLAPVESRYVIYSTSTRPGAIRAERFVRLVPAGAQHYVAARR